MTTANAEFDAYRRDFDAQPLQKMLGITLVERRPGFGRICLARTDTTPQGIGGSVHGGVLAAMVDIAMLVAVFSQLRPGQEPAGTADLNISYLRPARGRQVFADATVIKHGRQLAVIEVSIVDDENRLCAKGRTLYAFRSRE
jgi:acyl-CoA thioesterase